MSEQTTPDALARLATSLGEENVLVDPDRIAAYDESLIPVERAISGVVRPASHDEVVTTVRTADRHGMPIAPISRGKNWGYGSAKPPADDTVIVDLGRLDRIRTVDEELGYAVIEPAVTPGQLHEHLRENGIDLVVDPPGAGPNVSLVGNALERGIAAGRYHDRFGAVCSMRVVLPNGETVRTGFGAFDDARATHVYEYGVGPHLAGLFSQSNFGVVTEVGLWLAPKPERVEAFFVQVDGTNALPDLVGPIRELHRRGVVDAPIVVANRNRALTLATQCPDEYLGREIPERVLERMAEEHRRFDWNLVGALYGTDETLPALRQEVTRRFEAEGYSAMFVSEEFLESSGLGDRIPALRSTLELFEGVPNERSLRTAYWRVGTEPPEEDIDPTEDDCGVYWVSPVVPLTEADVRDFLACAREVFDDYHLEFCLNFDAVSSRAAVCLVPVLFDAAAEAETRAATELYERLHERFLEEGFVPYRESIAMMDEIAGDSAYWSLCRSIKRAIDPNHVLAPGRYERAPDAEERRADQGHD